MNFRISVEIGGTLKLCYFRNVAPWTPAIGKSISLMRGFTLIWVSLLRDSIVFIEEKVISLTQGQLYYSGQK